MILSLGRDSFHSEAYLLCLKSAIDEDAFLRMAKVKPKTYAGELLADLHDAIFHRSLELKHDYARFYAVEYSTFADYLQKRFQFDAKIIRCVNERFSRDQLILHFHAGYCFLEEDYGLRFLENLFEPRKKHED